MSPVERYAEAAFVLLVVGAALTPWPWLAAIVGGAFLVALAIVHDRRTPPPTGDA